MKNFITQKINKLNFENSSGFSIMETLVAIFILLISTTGPMVFSQNSLRTAFQARDQITAFYLAQDAIEFVKNRRDHNLLLPGTSTWWLTDLEDCVISGSGTDDSGCTIDTTSNIGTILSCSNDQVGCLKNEIENDIPLTVDSGTKFFGTDSSDNNSIFSRIIYINEVEENEEAEVVVKIRWTSHDSIGSREITVVENIYNWPGALGL